MLGGDRSLSITPPAGRAHHQQQENEANAEAHNQREHGAGPGVVLDPLWGIKRRLGVGAADPTAVV